MTAGSTQRFYLSLKALVLDPKRRVLLLRRAAPSKNNPGKWDFPGGKMDPGESFEDGLRREVREETGLEITLLRPFGTTMSTLPDRRVVYLFMLAETGTDRVRLSEEHDAFRWVYPVELTGMELVKQFHAVARRYMACAATGKLDDIA